MRWLKRLLQRLLVLALGMVTVSLIAFVFIDVAERRLPLVLAVAVTYGHEFKGATDDEGSEQAERPGRTAARH